MPLRTSLHAKAVEIAPRITALRRHLHAHPELSLHEHQTATFVATKLRELGLEPKMMVGGTGVCAVIEGGKPGKKTVALRADMDALPIQEQTGLPYASKNPGVMHACGHDGHTANLLGTAKLLLSVKSEFGGKVKLVFQPAEEAGGGARWMIEEKVLETPRVDAIFAFHGWPYMKVGEIGIRSGPTLATSDSFAITVTGRGTHAAYPEQGLNPISGLSRLVQELETIPATRISAAEAAIVSITDLVAGGTAYNVIPASGVVRGTFRTLSETVRGKIREEITRRARALEALGYGVNVELREGNGVTMNDPSLEPVVSAAVTAQLGKEQLVSVRRASMGAEDFSRYGTLVPAYFMRLGVGDRPALHNPGYDFNDDALPFGMEAFARIALEFLGKN
jgi:amidohydrolase